MIATQSIFHKKFRSLALRVFRYLENNGNYNFATNGEDYFVKNLFHYLKSLKGEVILFDVGANIGDYAQLLLDRSKVLSNEASIHVFEPVQSCFEILQNRFAQNSRMVLNRKAVSNTNGEVEIYFDKQGSELASLYRRNLSAYSLEMKTSERVEAVRLDSYIEESNVKHIHFLKMDIEGHELAALEGLGHYLSQQYIDFVQFEYGGANLDSHSSLIELFKVFDDTGFVVAKVMPKGLDIRSYYPWMDNFEYANYVAISEDVVPKLK